MPVLRRLRAAVTLSVLTTAVLFATPGAGLALCRMPPPIAEVARSADVVFVGAVTATANDHRWATVAVQEIWRGPDMPPVVLVKGGGADPNRFASTDRDFSVGERYLFIPRAEPDGSFDDSMCSSTQLWDDSLDVLRPADARLGQVDMRGDVPAFDFGFVVAIGGFVLLVVAVMLGVGLLERGRSD